MKASIIKDTIEALKAVEMGEGSVENLSRIAAAWMVEKPMFGWTQGACERLRDSLIDTLSQLDPSDWADETLASEGLARLPLGRDGLPIGIGDTVFGEDGVSWGVASVTLGEGEPYAVCGVHREGDTKLRHLKPEWLSHERPTVEGLLSEYHMHMMELECERGDAIDADGAELVEREMGRLTERTAHAMRELVRGDDVQ